MAWLLLLRPDRSVYVVSVAATMLNFIAPASPATGRGEPTPVAMAEWLDSLPPHGAAAAARAIIERLVSLNRAAGNARGRLRLMDLSKDHITLLIPRLERHLDGAALPLAPDLRETAYLVEKLLKELALGYSAAVLQTPRSWLALGARRQILAPLTETMNLLAQRVMLTHRLHAPGPAGVWAELHRLYALARELGVAEQRPASPRPAPEAIYRDAMLLALAEPARLTAGDLAQVERYLADAGELAEIGAVPPDGEPRGVFVIDPRRDRPGTAVSKRRASSLGGSELFLVTRKLVDRLEVQIARLETGVNPDSLGLPRTGSRLVLVQLLRHLASKWKGERRSRSARQHFHPRIRLRVGLDEIWQISRVSDAARAAAARQPSDWTITNESAGGFRLKYLSGTPPALRVGDVVAVDSDGGTAAPICLVRWVVSNSPEHVEIGLQQIARTVASAVGQTEPSDAARRLPVLFVPHLPQRGAPGVLVPAGRLNGASELFLRKKSGLAKMKLVRTLERTDQVEIIELAVEPGEPGA